MRKRAGAHAHEWEEGQRERLSCRLPAEHRAYAMWAPSQDLEIMSSA